MSLSHLWESVTSTFSVGNIVFSLDRAFLQAHTIETLPYDDQNNKITIFNPDSNGTGLFFFIHGGGFGDGFSRYEMQRHYMNIADTIDWPLASPDFSLQTSESDMLDDITNAYNRVSDKYPNRMIFVFGASSGAYVALSLLQSGRIHPSGLILDSPITCFKDPALFDTDCKGVMGQLNVTSLKCFYDFVPQVPMFVGTPTIDSIVPTSQTKNWKAAKAVLAHSNVCLDNDDAIHGHAIIFGKCEKAFTRWFKDVSGISISWLRLRVQTLYIRTAIAMGVAVQRFDKQSLCKSLCNTYVLDSEIRSSFGC